MASRREEVWASMYKQAVAYVKEHRQMPPKSSKEFGYILNWWKYNRKMYNKGLLNKDRAEKLIDLSNMRDYHVFS